jgi:hypothetical protein
MVLAHVRRGLGLAVAAALLVLAATPSPGAVLRVPADHARITDALAVADSGDVVLVDPGTYSSSANGEVFPLFLLDDVALLGSGFESCTIDAESTATVVRVLATGPTRISGFTITGGFAFDGGGVFVSAGTCTIDSNLVMGNVALSAGSGIFVNSGGIADIHHNVVWENLDADLEDSGDPHGIQLAGSDSRIENNLVGRGDSNGLLMANCEPVVQNNIFYENGTPGVRGRGICNFGGPATVIAHNLFFGNAIAPIVMNPGGGNVNVSAAEANDISTEDAIYGNLDGDPGFVNADAGDWGLTFGSPALDNGHPASADDPDGTPADIGPFFLDQSLVGVGEPGLTPVALAVHPNPARSRAAVAFDLEASGRVRIAAHDIRGRRVAVIVDRVFEAGSHTVVWDGSGAEGRRLPAGVYFLRADGLAGLPGRVVLVSP